MDSVWNKPSAGELFINSLKEQRFSEFVNNLSFLASLRHNWDMVQSYQKTFKKQLDAKETTMAVLVLNASEILLVKNKYDGQTKIV